MTDTWSKRLLPFESSAGDRKDRGFERSSVPVARLEVAAQGHKASDADGGVAKDMR